MVTAKHRFAFLFFFLITIVLNTSADPQPLDPDFDLHDAIYSRTVTYEIKDAKKKGCYFSSLTEIEIGFPEGRSSSDNYFSITQPGYTKIDKIKGECKGTGLKKDDIVSLADDRDAFLTNERVYILHFPVNMKPGDELWYSYRTNNTDLAFFPVHYIPNETLMKRYAVQINHPSDMDIDFDFFFPRDSLKYTIAHPSATVTALSFDSMPKAPALPYFPFNSFQASFVTRISRNGAAINPVTPEHFAKWYSEFLDTIPRSIDSLPGPLKVGLDTTSGNMAKLKVIDDYVRANVRYLADAVGMNAIIPHAPSFILQNLYGDCKDRAFLCQALAGLYGIPVNLALVSSQAEPSFPGVHGALFNHLICSYQDDSGTIFFDPTGKYYAFGNLAGSLIGTNALIIDSLRPRYEAISAWTREPSLEITISGSIARPESCSADLKLTGDYYAEAAEALKNMDLVERENFLSTMVNLQLANMTIDHFVLTGQNDHEIFLAGKADLTRFMVNSNNKKYIPATVFTLLKGEILERSGDPYDVYFDAPGHISLSLNLSAEEYDIAPDSIVMRCGDSISYMVRVRQSEGAHYVLDYALEILPRKIGGPLKSEFMQFCEEYIKNRTRMFVAKGVEK